MIASKSSFFPNNRNLLLCVHTLGGMEESNDERRNMGICCVRKQTKGTALITGRLRNKDTQELMLPGR